ncbi:MAG: 3-methyl-2-oxobutanoate hydroxymethyltransferase [Actinomycetota bacterium]|nr:3-methyl-2-oxobutanoate hydroxymethyltransferase [Actinomycetota bacterium]
MTVPATPPLSSCARAATAAEARYRIDAPIAPSRGARVIALDEGAAVVVREAASQPWASARFFVCELGSKPESGVHLSGIAGGSASLAEQLTDADVVVMVATEDAGAPCAYSIGRACWERSIMTAGLVLGNGFEADRAVAALRPHARVLLPSADAGDVIELLVALRA